MCSVVIDPVTCIEGRLEIAALTGNGEVKEARTSRTLSRCIELILQGRDLRDAPRIGGVCPIAHATASRFALDQKIGIKDRTQASRRIIRNLIFGCNFIQSHVLHFYCLAACACTKLWIKRSSR